MEVLVVLIGCAIGAVMCILGYFTTPGYRKKYKKCVADVDEVILDVYKATKMIPGMDSEDPMRINAIVVETIMANYLVQRIFTQGGVLYFKEINSKWIQQRLDIVKQTQIK